VVQVNETTQLTGSSYQTGFSLRQGDSPLVEIRGLTKRYSRAGESTTALSELHLNVQQGEFLGVVGPSGCGKSTLLNIVAGLLSPTSGVLRLAGQEVRGPNANIGMMFQKPVLLPWLTALENVLLPVRIATGSQADAAVRKRALELLEMVGLSGFENRYPKELSGGMAQRVAICRMLIRDPALLLMDEPFGALDELTREHLNTELMSICRRTGKTAIFITHSISEAIFMSDRVLVMCSRPGRVVGTLEVPLPKPRPVEIMTSVAFNDLVAQARALLAQATAGSPSPLAGASAI
jgi:NitT/TauT family transport system ATP-binding protein